MDFFILWGIVAFALNFIPVIGSIVAGVPPTILALLVAGVPNAILVAGGYLLINNFLGQFLEPILVGRRFGISTLVVVISVMFWGWVWGPLGNVAGGAADHDAQSGARWQRRIPLDRRGDFLG